MARKFRDISRATPAQRERAITDARVELDRMGLTALRRVHRLSQQEIAERLGIDQGSISRMEGQSDMLVRSLRRYIEALGGELAIVVTFPDDRVIELEGIGNLEPAPTRSPAREAVC